MSFVQWFSPPRHLLAMYLAVMALPAMALAWLGWRIMEQERAFESQRNREYLEQAADQISTAMERRLTGLSEALQSDSLDVPPTALAVRLNSTGVVARRGAALLYRPALAPSPAPPPEVFAAGERLEFQAHDYAGAAAEFKRLAATKDPAIRAGALVRLARNLRREQHNEEALKTYQALSELGPVITSDLPAEFLGQYQRCLLLRQIGRLTELEQCATALRAGLGHGRWVLDRDAYEYYSREIGRWSQDAAPASPADLALTAAVDWLWSAWQPSGEAKPGTRGVRSLWIHGQPVLVFWRSSAEEMEALAALPAYFEPRLRSAWQTLRVNLTLADGDGHVAFGNPARMAGPQAIRASSDTHLPWTLRVTSATTGLPEFAARRRMFLAGFGLAVALVVLAGYFTARAIVRELAVSRLQSDFVSAVSHEFRTPITSMRHLAELLMRGGISSDESRQRFYPALARETERLHRLVETLLNFGRMEAGAMDYHFEPVKLADLVESVAGEFRSEAALDGHRIEIRADRTAPPVLADRELMARAVWNLLDNAVKYSPGALLVEVEIAREADGVAVRVRDQGPGIDAGEQEAIFQKFVRGAASKAANVKGTGIGLAMVCRIVRAHGGEIRVASEPGHGSTFTILLPAGEQSL